MHLVSVIIPVYNVELYLARCINSILNQTYTNLQIIVVNDGSTDSSLEILNKFEDQRLIIVSKENGGLSSARNEGLKYVAGDYITFVDSDDWIKKDMIEIMVQEANRKDADIVTVFSKRVHSNKEETESLNNSCKTEYYTNEDCMSQLLLNKVPNYTWGKLYKTEIFTKFRIRFPEGKNYEDVATSYKIFNHCKKLVIIHMQLYFYFIRCNSIVHTKRIAEVYSMVEHVEEMNNYYIKNTYWGIYRLKIIYGAYMYALCLPFDTKKTIEYKKLIDKIVLLSNSIKTEKPLFFYINTPHFYKIFLLKTRLTNLLAYIKRIISKQ